MAAPLTPPECDLQDFPFMPLHVARLRDSDLAAEAAPEACWYAVLLWAAAWHQIPAASLPDNDATLARLIGLGRDLRTFRKHKADAMRGFVLCDDGRLYHPVVADQALAAWESKLQQRWRTECARIKKANQRHGTERPQPTYEEWLAARDDDPSPPSVPVDVPEDEPPCPPGHRIQETGTGTERLKKNPPTPLPGGDGPRSEMFEQAWNAWPEAGRGNHGPDQASAEWAWAITRAGGEERLLVAVQRRAAYLAKHPSERPKTFHRWLRDGGFASYVPAEQDVVVPWAGPSEVWLAIVTAKDEAFARSWLANCAWQDAPVKAVVSQSPTTLTRLRQEVGPVLSAMGIQILEIAA